jgi:type IV fimbrial biogenesis protein FimT
VLSTRHNTKGMTLVEILVALTIVVGLLAMATPSFSEWVQNTKIRSAADSMQNAISLAKTAAVHRNAVSQFVSCGGAFGEPSWDVIVASATASTNICNAAGATAGWERIQARAAQGGANTAVASITQSTVGFNGLGRQTSTTDLTSATATPSPPVAVAMNVSTAMNMGAALDSDSCYCPAGNGDCGYPADITFAATGKLRCLRISISPSGQVRMCDPALTSGPQKC